MRVIYRGTIEGEPVGKGRPRVYRTPTGVRGVTPKRTREWTDYAVRVMAFGWKKGAPLAVPVKVTMKAIKTRPKRLYRKADPDGLMWRPHKPDADNCLKSLADALTKAGIVEDDALIVHMVGFSLYAEKGGAPRMEVEISTVDVLK